MTKSATIAALRAELEEQQRLLADPLEGMNDFVRVGNGVEGEKEMRRIAEGAAQRYQRRADLVTAALEALEALDGDDFPLIPLIDVSTVQFDLFERNARTLTAALAVLNPFEPADGGEVRFGAGRRKDTLPAAVAEQAAAH